MWTSEKEHPRHGNSICENLTRLGIVAFLMKYKNFEYDFKVVDGEVMGRVYVMKGHAYHTEELEPYGKRVRTLVYVCSNLDIIL